MPQSSGDTQESGVEESCDTMVVANSVSDWQTNYGPD